MGGVGRRDGSWVRVTVRGVVGQLTAWVDSSGRVAEWSSGRVGEWESGVEAWN